MSDTDEGGRWPVVLWEGEAPFGDSAGGVGMGAARVVRLPQRGWSVQVPLAVERRYLDALCAPRWDPADERERAVVLEQAVRDLAVAVARVLAVADARATAPEGEPQGEELRAGSKVDPCARCGLARGFHGPVLAAAGDPQCDGFVARPKGEESGT